MKTISLYDNDTKNYPDLNTTAPQESQVYCLKNLGDVQTYLLDEVEIPEQVAKK